MTDHAEVRRDAELTETDREWLHKMPAWSFTDGKKIEAKFDALLAELEQAERERDEVKEWLDHEKQVTRDLSARLDPHARGAGLGTRSIHAQRLDAEFHLRKRAEKAEARLASVPALVEALELAVGALEAARDRGDKFGAAAWRGGIVATLFALDAALTVYEQSQGNG